VLNSLLLLPWSLVQATSVQFQHVLGIAEQASDSLANMGRLAALSSLRCLFRFEFCSALTKNWFDFCTFSVPIFL